MTHSFSMCILCLFVCQGQANIIYMCVCIIMFKTFRLLQLQHSLSRSVFLCSDFQEIVNIGITKANGVQQNEGLTYYSQELT